VKRRFALGTLLAFLGSGLFASAFPAPAAAKSHSNCGEFKFGGGTFPTDCGASGSLSTPGFQQWGSGPSEFGMNTFFCESPQLIYRTGLGKFCYNEPSPYGVCKQAIGTFWYLEAGFKARTLDGYGGQYIELDSNIFPLSFTSSSLIVPANVYGLCVLADGSLMQDDFASGTAVAPNGNTANMQMVLASQYVEFFGSEGFTIYLEAAPAQAYLKRNVRRAPFRAGS
jgi:hypothetical protein